MNRKVKRSRCIKQDKKHINNSYLRTYRFFSANYIVLREASKKEKVHVFEIKEITLEAKNEYQNPYTEIECWLDLKGPDFNKRICGFWDGGNTFRIRIAATKPGDWTWTCGSNQTDKGLKYS